MPVTNIECQLAKGQIGRFLSGDGLSAESLRQLEAHISECPECKIALIERKAALQAMLEQPASAKAVVEKPSETPRPKNPTHALIEALRNKEAGLVEEKPASKAEAIKRPSKSTKPLILSCALAGVLIAMSWLSRPGSPLFGPKVEEALPSGVSNTAKAPEPTATNPTAIQTPPSAVDRTTPPRSAAATPTNPPVVAPNAASTAAPTQTPEKTQEPVAEPVVKTAKSVVKPPTKPQRPAQQQTPVTKPAAKPQVFTQALKPAFLKPAAKSFVRIHRSRRTRRGVGSIRIYN